MNLLEWALGLVSLACFIFSSFVKEVHGYPLKVFGALFLMYFSLVRIVNAPDISFWLVAFYLAGALLAFVGILHFVAQNSKRA